MSHRTTERIAPHRRIVVAGTLCVLGFAGGACSALTGVTPVLNTSSTVHYVALGDSYTAGPLIPNQVGSPSLCLRSDHNYPSLTEQSIRPASFSDVSCSGAVTSDMTSSQNLTLGSNAPQFNALSASTTLVSVGIGGNDIGFSSIIETCAAQSLTNPTGAPCKAHYTSGGTDQLAQTIQNAAPKIAATLQGIHQRSPQAKIFILGYPNILPTTGSGCFPTVPIAAGDVPYLNSVEQELNTMISQQASANGATYVDTFTSSIGHDACQPSGTKWVEGLFPTDLAAPVHPNTLGMQNDATNLEAALKSAGITH